MSSWFSAFSDTVASVSEKVSNAIPLDRELIDKLTLNTDEMKATREQFGEDATRKAAAKDLLAKMLPWGTNDKERDILVDECKEAILALSSDEATFYGPFEMPELDVNMEEEEDEKKKKSSESDDEEEEEEEEIVDEEDEEEKRKRLLPSEESLEKLAQLEPLPPLLQDFDLECHVGLIQMILKEDPKLVEMQSNISGGGKREEIFWRNYFFHCAYTRYEAGLSIDEIWSFSPETAEPVPAAAKTAAVPLETNEADEEQVVFDDKDAASPQPAFSPDDTDTTDEATPAEPAAETPEAAEEPEAFDLNNGDFDFLDDDDDDDDQAATEPAMDELEAEIMAELEG
ncbi:unnamed protein product [Cylindrotheca closterium]|uniref:BSD domain-containing protein n=1 Tax=Cylindrotheca closterium TaxID=2856 RepID=A0AAD2CR68_9STRA|nr:unnamed protein product [Cylindrotheca closterium]